LDENWTYFNDEQLAEVSGLTLDSIQDEDISNMFEKSLENGRVV
jgi:hypothetical protein